MKTSKLIFTILLSLFIIILLVIIILLIIRIRKTQKRIDDEQKKNEQNKKNEENKKNEQNKKNENPKISDPKISDTKISDPDPIPIPTPISFDFYKAISGFIPQFSEKFSSIAAQNIQNTLIINKNEYRLFENLFANAASGNRKNFFSAFPTYWWSHNYTPNPDIQVVKFLNTDVISFYLPKEITKDDEVKYSCDLDGLTYVTFSLIMKTYIDKPEPKNLQIEMAQQIYYSFYMDLPQSDIDIVMDIPVRIKMQFYKDPNDGTLCLNLNNYSWIDETFTFDNYFDIYLKFLAYLMKYKINVIPSTIIDFIIPKSNDPVNIFSNIDKWVQQEDPLQYPFTSPEGLGSIITSEQLQGIFTRLNNVDSARIYNEEWMNLVRRSDDPNMFSFDIGLDENIRFSIPTDGDIETDLNAFFDDMYQYGNTLQEVLVDRENYQPDEPLLPRTRVTPSQLENIWKIIKSCAIWAGTGFAKVFIIAWTKIGYVIKAMLNWTIPTGTLITSLATSITSMYEGSGFREGNPAGIVPIWDYAIHQIGNIAFVSILLFFAVMYMLKSFFFVDNSNIMDCSDLSKMMGKDKLGNIIEMIIPQPDNKYFRYKVQNNDTCQSICNEFKIKMDDLIVNNIKLNVFKTTIKCCDFAICKKYTVKDNDTCTKIADYYGITTDELLKLNLDQDGKENINCDKLQIGQIINVPISKCFDKCTTIINEAKDCTCKQVCKCKDITNTTERPMYKKSEFFYSKLKDNCVPNNVEYCHDNDGCGKFPYVKYMEISYTPEVVWKLLVYDPNSKKTTNLGNYILNQKDTTYTSEGKVYTLISQDNDVTKNITFNCIIDPESENKYVQIKNDKILSQIDTINNNKNKGIGIEKFILNYYPIIAYRNILNYNIAFVATNCQDSCLSFTDNNNCAMCGNTCKENESCCNGVCIDYNNDKNNCGGCGKVCKENEYCCDGVCKTTESKKI